VSRTSHARKVLLGWIAGGLLGAVAILPLCDLAFDCGCRLPGLGGYAHCDIHTAGAPDCPWCEKPLRFAAVGLLAYAAAAAVGWCLPRRWPLWALALAGLVTIVAVTLAGGAVTSLALGREVLAGL
jgi:hypothetical protein